MNFKKVVVNGVRGVKFVKYVVEAKFKRPEDFIEITQVIEYRRDPLTGRWCRINVLRTLRELPRREIDVSKVFEDVKSFCPFCKHNVYVKTPKFSIIDIDR